jgi:predicted nucleic acid-binding protein
MPAQRDLVINTGPLLALAAAGQLDVLRKLFTKIVVPHKVVQEVEAGGRTQFAREEFRAASWLEKRTSVTVLPPLLQSTLDPGEASVIAVATSERIAIVAIDETVGRRIGRLHGLSITGSLGILIQAKRQGSPILLRSAIAKMRERGIWLSAALEKECLRAAGE